ncbi:hypothetical protein BC835DRAFT_1266723 [Cytidiella melzeri]|nr:hypothetical protein BC835DRAFT_1266723 [Cytidiella melzeri]
MFLRNFFAQYPTFDYRPSQPVMAEFYRLCDHKGWDKDDPAKANARELLREAMAHHFNAIYGTDVDDLQAMHNMCTTLRINPVPPTVAKCRQAIQGIYVNICDLVDEPQTHVPPMLFPTELALSEYTKRTGKYYPRENIHTGDLMRFLLRQIMNPSLSEGRTTRHGRGRAGASRRTRGRGK